ncbi:MAG: FmdB family zinc ribbon protein [Candidatus Omnitrophota bacterium]
MPTYEYECTKCGNRFDVFQSITAQPVKRCPKCRCKVRRLISAGTGIIFKGSGFYQTDYKNKSASGGSGKCQGDKENPECRSCKLNQEKGKN